MTHSETKRTPSRAKWIIALALGLVAAAGAHAGGNFSYPQSGFVGIVVFLLVTWILGLFRSPAATPEEIPANVSATAVPPMVAPTAPSPLPTPAVAAPAMAKPAPTASVSGPAAMFTSAQAEPTPPAKPARTATSKPADKAPGNVVAVTVGVKPAVAKAPKVKKPDGPLRLSAPRNGKADNLKEIEGIGPALEKLCNELGFYHFDQIAGWSDADVAWVDANMKTFKGRVVRDDWIAQSKIIVTEGLEAFRLRAKPNDY